MLCVESGIDLSYGLTAELAAVGCEWDVGEALGAGLGTCGFGPFEPGNKLLCGKDQEEVDDEGDDEEIDDGVDEVADLDGRRADSEDDVGEVGLAHDGGDERGNDVIDQGFGDCGEGAADDYGDGEVHNIAAQNKVSKAF